MLTKSRKILIVAPSWVGDMVMAQALLKLLKQSDPTIIIDVLAPPYLSALLSRMPEVNKVILSPFKHGELALRRRFVLARNLRTCAYNQAIVLPNSLKSTLIPWFAKIPLRTGWRGEMRYVLLNDVRTLGKNTRFLSLMVERFVALGLSKEEILPPDLPMPTLRPDDPAGLLQRLGLTNLSPPRSVLALCVGAEYGPAKRWPAEYFAKIAEQQIQKGWEVWLIGSEKDQFIAKEIQSFIGVTSAFCKDLTGKTTLAEAVDLLALASLVISNDSGLMHIAAALDVPLVAIYGSSSSGFTPPLSSNATILSLKLSCSPCFKRTCPLGHFKCMLELTPQKVAEAIVNY